MDTLRITAKEKSCQDFLDDRIRKICGLPPDTSITEEFLRKGLDEADLKATALDPGFRRRHPGMRLLTHEEAVRRREEVRTAQF